MWEWLIIVAVVGASAFTLARRFWRMGRASGPSCGCSGCSGCAGGDQCPGAPDKGQGGSCRGCGIVVAEKTGGA